MRSGGHVHTLKCEPITKVEIPDKLMEVLYEESNFRQEARHDSAF